MQSRRKKINDILRDKCKAHKFTFIENNDIVLSRHIRRDGVHLNVVGTEKLANNFLSILNSNASRKEDFSASSIASDETEICPVGGH